MAELIFNEAEHSYTVDGTRVPSVTQILTVLGFHGDRKMYFTEAVATRGSIVHEIIEEHIKGTLIEDIIHDDYVGYFKAFCRFENESSLATFPALIEAPLYSEQYRFAGKPDIIGKLNGRESVIDIKTGDPGHAAQVQTAAYEILYGKPLKRYALRLNPDWTYKLTEYADKGDKNIFLSALAVYHWQKNKGVIK
jgi:hypothetical protein